MLIRYWYLFVCGTVCIDAVNFSAVNWACNTHWHLNLFNASCLLAHCETSRESVSLSLRLILQTLPCTSLIGSEIVCSKFFVAGREISAWAGHLISISNGDCSIVKHGTLWNLPDYFFLIWLAWFLGCGSSLLYVHLSDAPRCVSTVNQWTFFVVCQCEESERSLSAFAITCLVIFRVVRE